VCDVKKETLNGYCTEVRKLEDHLEGLEFHHFSHENNVAADVLSKLGSKHALVLAGVFVQDLRKPSIRLLSDPETSPSDVLGSRDVLMAEAEVDWRLDFIAYIMEKRVPEDKVEREKIVIRTANYVVIGSELYQRSASSRVLMKCILQSKGLGLLQEIHSGECGNHVASTNLVGKTYRSGFYWPTAMADTQDLVWRCKCCQFFTKQQHVPAQFPRTIPPSWPFVIWGLDSVGPFKTAPGGYNHILMAMDKFTEWIKVRAVTLVASKEAAKFIEDITHWFGVPNRSSPTWARPLQGQTSGTFAKAASSMSTIPRWPTHCATARSSDQTVWCFKPSRTASLTTPHSSRLGGTQNYLTSSRASEPRSARSRDTRRSFWYTHQRRCSQLT
jgi:hypothetical protein